MKDKNKWNKKSEKDKFSLKNQISQHLVSLIQKEKTEVPLLGMQWILQPQKWKRLKKLDDVQVHGHKTKI